MLMASVSLPTDGLPTHGLEAGAGADALVWFPALLDSAAGFGRTMLALRRQLPQSVRVLAIDPPGYGHGIEDAQALLPISRWDAWCDSLARLLEERCAGRFVFVGNSSGGVAATLAARATQRCAGLVLACWCDWRERGCPDGSVLCPCDRAGVERLLARAWHRPPVLTASALAGMLAQSRSPRFIDHVASFDPDVYRSQLASFTRPLILIGGEHDGLVPIAALRETAQVRPGTPIHVVPNCGHYPHRERTQAFASLLANATLGLLGAEDPLADQESATRALHGVHHGTELEN
jgi:pimeloyl-ACP methyl ester carboxylesterase